MYKRFLVYYSFYHEDIENKDSPVENINVRIANVWADNERQAEEFLIEYHFGENIIEILKTEEF